MATVVLTPTALEDLDRLIRTLSLPPSTRARLKTSLRPLETFPQLGAHLHGRWSSYRFVLGPWRWMIVVYAFDEALDLIGIITIQTGARPHSARDKRDRVRSRPELCGHSPAG